MRGRDEERYREFVVGRARVLRRTAFLLCGDWHLAEDLMQATLVKMYRVWSRLERRGELDAYVRRVLVRTWLDEWRKPWRRAEWSVGVVPDGPDDGVGVEEVAGRLDARNVVHGALLVLPPRQRATLVLRYFDDLSVAETAAVLGCSEGNVKSQTSRGLRALRDHLGEAGAESLAERAGETP